MAGRPENEAIQVSESTMERALELFGEWEQLNLLRERGSHYCAMGVHELLDDLFALVQKPNGEAV